jgi:hypothetical protein
MASYEPPKVNEKKYTDATSEMWLQDDTRYCFTEDGGFNPECVDVITADLSIDKKTQKSHAEWVSNSARWQGSSSSFRQDRIEPIIPSGWFYKMPSAVPVSYDRATIPDYGPMEFAELEGKGNGFYKHQRLQRHEFHPNSGNSRFRAYGI